MLRSSEARRNIEQAYTLHASSYLVKALDFQVFVAQIDAFVGFWTQARTTQWPDRLPGS